MLSTQKTVVSLTLAALLAVPQTLAAEVFVGNLQDLTGPTAFVGKPYAAGVEDAMNYITKQGGPLGGILEFEAVD